LLVALFAIESPDTGHSGVYCDRYEFATASFDDRILNEEQTAVLHVPTELWLAPLDV